MVYSIILAWVGFALVPKILDIIKPLNCSRPTFEVLPIEVWVDQVKYWWPVQIFIWLGALTILSIVPAFDTLYMALAQHACGMFEILRWCYRYFRKYITDNTTVSRVG